ncbi:hypothetical protein BS50DRAFT_576064 [Corynespora cassiicola Philippines]|uniref:Uncharacterized protein n=1 Tax=Corynespora cassiicola Philippines TaxID=1448308 RepID=A0A2T2NGY2_CORCC|nr:hypothetical protein BS50DRAFT_576064 [Corynespora cassiicola Philippines]
MARTGNTSLQRGPVRRPTRGCLSWVCLFDDQTSSDADSSSNADSPATIAQQNPVTIELSNILSAGGSTPQLQFTNPVDESATQALDQSTITYYDDDLERADIFHLHLLTKSDHVDDGESSQSTLPFDGRYKNREERDKALATLEGCEDQSLEAVEGKTFEEYFPIPNAEFRFLRSMLRKVCPEIPKEEDQEELERVSRDNPIDINSFLMHFCSRVATWDEWATDEIKKIVTKEGLAWYLSDENRVSFETGLQALKRIYAKHEHNKISRRDDRSPLPEEFYQKGRHIGLLSDEEELDAIRKILEEPKENWDGLSGYLAPLHRRVVDWNDVETTSHDRRAQLEAICSRVNLAKKMVEIEAYYQDNDPFPHQAGNDDGSGLSTVDEE